MNILIILLIVNLIVLNCKANDEEYESKDADLKVDFRENENLIQIAAYFKGPGEILDGNKTQNTKK